MTGRRVVAPCREPAEIDLTTTAVLITTLNRVGVDLLDILYEGEVLDGSVPGPIFAATSEELHRRVQHLGRRLSQGRISGTAVEVYPSSL